jgi:predicted enzyme related to lactoylglutathione lyase
MTDTPSATAGTVAWFELPAEDTRRSQEFYARLCGWEFQPFGPDDYHITFEAGGAIFGSKEQKMPNLYFGTDDIDAAITRVRELGGEAGERQDIPNDFGSFAHCRDTEGNAFSLYQAVGG